MSEAKRQKVLKDETILLGVKSKKPKKLVTLLTDYEFIEAKIIYGESSALINDYDIAINLLENHSLIQVGDDQQRRANVLAALRAMRHIQEALRLITDAVVRDISLLTPQLWATLRHLLNEVYIHKLLTRAAQAKDIWLQPLTASLAIDSSNALYSEHPNSARCITLCEARDLCIVDMDEGITAWSLKTGVKEFVFFTPVPSMPARSDRLGVLTIGIGTYENDEIVISIDQQGYTRYWDITNGELLTVAGEDRVEADLKVSAFAVCRDHPVFVIGCETGEVYICFFQKDQGTGKYIEYLSQRIDGLIDVSRVDEREIKAGLHQVSSVSIQPNLDLIQAACSGQIFYFRKDDQYLWYQRLEHTSFGRSASLGTHTSIVNATNNNTLIYPLDGSEGTSLSYGQGILMHCALSDDGSYAAVSQLSGIVNIIAIKERKIIQSFNASKDGVSSLAISSKGEHLVCGSLNSLRFWKIPKDKEIKTDLGEKPSSVENINFSPESNGFILTEIGYGKYNSSVWQIDSSGEISGRVEIDVNGANAVYNHDGSEIVVPNSTELGFYAYSPKGSYRSPLRLSHIRSVKTERFVQEFSLSYDGQYVILLFDEISPGDQIIEVRQIKSSLSLFGSRKRDPIQIIRYKQTSQIDKIDFIQTIPYTDKFFAWTHKETLLIGDIKRDELQVVKDYSVEHASQEGFYCACYKQRHSPHAVVARTSSLNAWEIDIWMYDHQTGTCVNNTFSPKSTDESIQDSFFSVSNAHLSRNNQIIVTSGRDGYAKVWQVNNEKLLAEYYLNNITSMAISPDAKIVVLCDSKDGLHVVRLTDCESQNVR